MSFYTCKYTSGLAYFSHIMPINIAASKDDLFLAF